MPSGSKIRLPRNWSNGIPEATSTTRDERIDAGQPAVPASASPAGSRAARSPAAGRGVARVSSGWLGKNFSRGMLREPAPPESRPEVWVSRSLIVISRSAATSSTSDDPLFSTATFMVLNSGMNFETGSDSRTLPSSTIMSTATPATGLVDEAMRKRVSVFIGCLESTSITPCASKSQNLASPRHQRDGTRDPVLVDVPLDRLMNPPARRRRDADLFRLRSGQVAGPGRGRDCKQRKRTEKHHETAAGSRGS